jgi:hypothetical protein
MSKPTTTDRISPPLKILLFLAFSTPIAGAQIIDDDWVPDDIVVSNPERTMLDPEFDAVSGYVAWLSGPSEQTPVGLLRGALIDDTGDFIDPVSGTPLRLGGHGVELDRDLVSIDVTRNGPEFALAAGGTRMLYTKFNAAGEKSLAQLVYDGANWLPRPLNRAQNRITPEGSKDADDPLPRMAYFSANRELLGVRAIDSARTERIADRLLNGSNFMPGEPAILATSVADDGVRQVYYYDYVANVTTQITFDGAPKIRSPEPWAAPELNGETLFTVATRRNGEVFARVYSRAPDDTWSTFAEVFSPDPEKPFIRSPRPFVYRGVSYLLLRTQRDPGDDIGNDLWIVNADPDPAARVYRRVNAPGEVRRADQEAFVTASGPVVYYSEFVAGAIKVTRRCRTGIPAG